MTRPSRPHVPSGSESEVVPRLVSGPPDGWQESFLYDLGNGRFLHGHAETWTRAGDPGRHWHADGTFHGIVRFEHICDRGKRGVIICAPLLQIDNGHTLTGTSSGPTVRDSIACEDCGTHGWVTDGKWTDA